MTDTTFLIIDGFLISDLERDNYVAYEQEMGKHLRMAHGNMVYEKGSLVWVIKANFADIGTEALEGLYAAMSGKDEHTIAFLPSNGKTALQTAAFYLTERPQPSLSDWTGLLPDWSDYSMKFEEIEPHD